MNGGTRECGHPGAQCVLYHPRGRGPDPELLEALCRGDLNVVVCDDAFTALAHLCCNAAPESKHGKDQILLLAEPMGLTRTVQLVHAVERFVPHTACWAFDPAANPRLHAVTPNEIESWIEAVNQAKPRHAPRKDTPIAPAASARGSASPGASVPPPKLRLAGEGTMNSCDSGCEVVSEDVVQPLHLGRTGTSDNTMRSGQLPQNTSEIGQSGQTGELRGFLSSEELAMLLANDSQAHQD